MPCDKVPSLPGVYIFRDSFGKIIYVGKSRNLRRRVSQYFQKSRARTEDPKFRSLVNSIDKCEVITVKTENEALLLESKLIKEYSPYYNVLMRDDKRFLMVKINTEEKFPAIRLVRIRKNDPCLYFGPFPKTGALRDTVEFLNAYLGLRSCHPEIPTENDHRHCLRKIIEHCSAPCVGKIDEKAYRDRVNNLLEILNGNVAGIICEIRKKMADASSKKNYESAAKYRDIISNMEATICNSGRNFRFAKLANRPGAEALRALRNALGLSKDPLRIEAFDISNISGQLAVAGMVVFSDGLPDSSKYRRFRIRSVSSPDDYAMIRKAVYRRFKRLAKEGGDLPDLILIDGGKGQLSMALEALRDAGMKDIPIASLAKKNEEIFIPGCENAIMLDRDSPSLHLVQAIRDEAHRFALTYHRKLREKRIKESLLDEIDSIGNTRKKLLLKEFGCLDNIRKATIVEIESRVPGIGAKFAKKIHDFFNRGKS